MNKHKTLIRVAIIVLGCAINILKEIELDIKD